MKAGVMYNVLKASTASDTKIMKQVNMQTPSYIIG